MATQWRGARDSSSSGCNGFLVRPFAASAGRKLRVIPVSGLIVRVRHGVTINDVAREAGVSLRTVSGVVDNQRGAKETSLQEVFAVIQRFGFQPDLLTRGMRVDMSHTLPHSRDLIDATFSALADTVTSEAYDFGF